MRYGPMFPYAGARPLQEYFTPAQDVGGGITGMTNLGAGTLPNFMPAGAIVPAYDNYWGGAEFIYVQANGTIRQWGLCIITPALVSGRIQFQATEVTNTANLVRPLGVALNAMAANQFGWLGVGGLLPVNSSASVAANTPLGIAAAGQAGADSAGKEILNAINILPATTTVVKNCLVTANSPIIRVTGNNDFSGWFLGVALSGTGIPASTVISAVDADGKTVTMNNNATASGGVSVTGTYNDGASFYNVAHLNRPFAQGRIT